MANIDFNIFSQHEWNHFHDAVLHATDKRSTREELEELYKQLPIKLHHIAEEWGMNDTEFREGVIEWLENE